MKNTPRTLVLLDGHGSYYMDNVNLKHNYHYICKTDETISTTQFKNFIIGSLTTGSGYLSQNPEYTPSGKNFEHILHPLLRNQFLDSTYTISKIFQELNINTTIRKDNGFINIEDERYWLYLEYSDYIQEVGYRFIQVRPRDKKIKLSIIDKYLIPSLEYEKIDINFINSRIKEISEYAYTPLVESDGSLLPIFYDSTDNMVGVWGACRVYGSSENFVYDENRSVIGEIKEFTLDDSF